LKNDKFKELFVPYYDSLSIEKMLEWCSANAREVYDYFPEESEIMRLPRNYICNLIHSVVRDPFRAWVGEMIKQRNTNVVEKFDLAVKVEPEILKAIKNSGYISTHHGRSNHLLKQSAKRKRTKIQMAAAKVKEEREGEVLAELKRQNALLQQQIDL